MLDAALALAGAGYAVFPVVPRGKRPITARGFKDASRDTAIISEWWADTPTANIGLPTGAAQGFFVLDVDGEEGAASLRALEAQHGSLPATRTVKTGGGGLHIWFRYPEAAEVGSNAGKIGAGLDVRGNGGYVVAAPSVHESGNTYEYANGSDQAIADAPKWLLNLVVRPPEGAVSDSGPNSSGVAPVYLDSGQPMRLSLDEISSIVAEFDPDMDYDGWLKVGMALHHEGAGEISYLAIWDNWSKLGSKYKTNDCASKWHTFGKKSCHPVTLRSLLWMSKSGPLAECKRGKDGSIKPNATNLALALSSPVVTGLQIRYDSFTDRVMLAPAGMHDQWREFGNDDYFALKCKLEAVGFSMMPTDNLREAVYYHAKNNVFDTAQHWLEVLGSWDGVCRVEGFLSRYMGAEDTPYTRAVSIYMWSALAGRILSPGCQADMVPILEGAQGVGKSTGIAAMVPSREAFGEISLDERDADLSRKIRGKLIIEMAELSGMRRRDIEAQKAFITRTREEWIPKFKELPEQYLRRCLFIGTTNSREVLSDSTGNRRWLPVHVTQIDRDAIAADRNQLWLEGVFLFKTGGIQWQAAAKLSQAEHENYQAFDLLRERLVEYLDTVVEGGKTQRQLGALSLKDVAQAVMGPECRTRSAETSLGPLMRAEGMVTRTISSGGRRRQLWYCEQTLKAQEALARMLE